MQKIKDILEQYARAKRWRICYSQREAEQRAEEIRKEGRKYYIHKDRYFYTVFEY